MDINGAGMVEEYRGSGGTAILFNELIRVWQISLQLCRNRPIGAENERMLQELSNFGIIFHKKHWFFHA